MAIVYIATNRVNGKRYVGVTKYAMETRRRQHFNSARSERVGCRIFYAAIRKYGEDAFDWTVLQECADYADALREEVRLIAELRPEYNVHPGGQGSEKTRQMSDEARARWRAAMVGRKYGPEHGEKITLAQTGKKRSAEARAKMSASRKGIVFTKEHRQNLGLARLGTKQSPETISKRALAQTGIPLSAEHKEKIRASLKGRPRPPHIQAMLAANARDRALKRWGKAS